MVYELDTKMFPGAPKAPPPGAGDTKSTCVKNFFFISQWAQYKAVKVILKKSTKEKRARKMLIEVLSTMADVLK